MSTGRQVITDGIVVRPFLSSLSSKATTRYKAHVVGCRYAEAPTMESMATLVERLGGDKVRTQVLVGIVETCKACSPVLLTEAGA